MFLIHLNVKKIDYNNKILLTLKTQSVKELAGEFVDEKDHGGPDIAFNSSGDIEKVFNNYHVNLKIAKEREDKAGEGYAYGSLGNAFEQVGDLKKSSLLLQYVSSYCKRSWRHAFEG